MAPHRPTSQRQAPGERIGQRIGRHLDSLFSAFAALVFIVLWGCVAVAALTDGALLSDVWSWLNALDTVPAIVVWLAILPVAVFLWAWQADLSPLAMGLVLLGLAAWTALAFSTQLGLRHRQRLGRAG